MLPWASLFIKFFLAKKQDIAHLLPQRLPFFCVPMVTLDHQEGADTLLAIWQSSSGEREAYYLPDAFGALYKLLCHSSKAAGICRSL